LQTNGENDITHQMSDTEQQNGTVLVIDDDPAIRHVLGFMLKRMGFNVLSVPDGKTGVDIYRNQTKEIVAVILDVIMLGMSSADTFKELQRINKDVQVYVSSGATDDVIEAAGPTGGMAGFIRKPYQQPELTAALGHLLRNRQTT